jgi:hypothetical protein
MTHAPVKHSTQAGCRKDHRTSTGAPCAYHRAMPHLSASTWSRAGAAGTGTA